MTAIITLARLTALELAAANFWDVDANAWAAWSSLCCCRSFSLSTASRCSTPARTKAISSAVKLAAKASNKPSIRDRRTPWKR